MNVVISTIVWGEEHFRNFTDYSLPSLLAARNIPASRQAGHTITLFLLTEQARIDMFVRSDLYLRSRDIVRYELRSIESHGFNPTRVPSGYNRAKYQFLSICQNIAIDYSKTFDVHIFNYADFVWAEHAVSNLIARFVGNSLFSVLGFAIPVEERHVKPVLDTERAADGTLALAPYEATTLALDHLHAEARLRCWDNATISAFPSYLYWNVAEEGILLRAFHQTLLAVAPTKGSALYNRGIEHGTLDGDFSSAISAHEESAVLDDMAQIFMFSIHRSIANTQSHREHKQDTLRIFAERHLTPQHAKHFATAIRIPRKAAVTESLWQQRVADSARDVDFIYSHIRPTPSGTIQGLAVDANWRNPLKYPALMRILYDQWFPRMRQYVRSIAFTLLKK